MQDAFAQSEDQTLESTARDLRARAGGFGFEVISEMAGQLEESIQGNADRETISGQLNEVLSLCQRARAPSEPDPVETPREEGPAAA